MTAYCVWGLNEIDGQLIYAFINIRKIKWLEGEIPAIVVSIPRDFIQLLIYIVRHCNPFRGIKRIKGWTLPFSLSGREVFELLFISWNIGLI